MGSLTGVKRLQSEKKCVYMRKADRVTSRKMDTREICLKYYGHSKRCNDFMRALIDIII